MQAAKYWRNNKLRYRLLGMKRPKNRDRAVLRPGRKPTPNYEEQLPREQVGAGG